MENLLKLLSLLKDPAIIALVFINWLLVRQNGKFIDVTRENTTVLSELSTLIGVLVSRRGKDD